MPTSARWGALHHLRTSTYLDPIERLFIADQYAVTDQQASQGRLGRACVLTHTISACFPNTLASRSNVQAPAQCLTPQMSIVDRRIGRRDFLAALGLSTGGVALLASPTLAVASVKPGNKSDHPLYRRGLFRRGSTWTTPEGSLVVTRKRAIRSHDGTSRFDRNSFEVVFAKESGKHPGHGTTTLTNSEGTQVPLHLTQIRPNRYSAVIHRQPIPGGSS
jgi:hypothetical protein